MAAKRVQFADSGGADDELEKVYEEATGSSATVAGSKQQTRFGFKEKHSLDSDEEDIVENYDMLHDDDIEGQEDTNVDIEEGMTFTPFNMREELEEGHFDSEGMYIFKKEDQIKDHWIDNIDWVKIKERKQAEKDNDDDDDDDDSNTTPVDELHSFRQMVELMKPGESVLKALRRLGGGKAGSASSSASQRWKAKKQKDKKSDLTSEAEAADKESLLKLTGLADTLLTQGNFEIYQHTYEKLSFMIKLAENKEKAKKPNIPDDAEDDDALDMFADDFDKKNKNTEEEDKTATNPSVSEAESKDESKPTSEESEEVMWEYKWENKDVDEVHGPYTSPQMLDWSKDGFFDDGVFVRKVGTSGKFYSSNRIDFELYT